MQFLFVVAWYMYFTLWHRICISLMLLKDVHPMGIACPSYIRLKSCIKRAPTLTHRICSHYQSCIEYAYAFVNMLLTLYLGCLSRIEHAFILYRTCYVSFLHNAQYCMYGSFRGISGEITRALRIVSYSLSPLMWDAFGCIHFLLSRETRLDVISF